MKQQAKVKQYKGSNAAFWDAKKNKSAPKINGINR